VERLAVLYSPLRQTARGDGLFAPETRGLYSLLNEPRKEVNPLVQIRLLALDVDGTLVDPDGQLSPRVRSAVQQARDRGLAIVICTGRRYRTTRSLVADLGLSGSVVLHNGVVVKDATSGETIANHYLTPELYGSAMEIMRGVATPLVYVDHYDDGIDLYAEPAGQCHEFQTEYAADNSEVVREIESLDRPPSESVVMISAMADRETLIPIERRIREVLGKSVATNFIANKNYRGHILEVVLAGASKWAALSGVATELGIEARAIAAIGDDNNDLDMIRNSGLGIAPANAIPAVLEAADHITASNADDGAAQAIEDILRGKLVPREN
jgi:Cof subfamily protein (haloacid dehalogenase superfamily)